MESSREERKIEISKLGQDFMPGTHVEFTYHRHHFSGVVEKQLRNSAILVFDDEFKNTTTALDLKQKMVISYQKMTLQN